ncbi:antitoxin VbhA family protein [Gardnerella vaginalis]|uniref:antitoxin VbhA family protein n=1 Tax=Gardnerella vaginalis TaxID=2702 RepID=UPI0039EEA98E
MIDKETQKFRLENVAIALSSAKLEGGTVSSACLADTRKYIRGSISADELISITRKRYGLK